ncbi:MAG: plastocyanin/azurin family copper-binding protein [Chloroflexota bacterium]
MAVAAAALMCFGAWSSAQAQFAAEAPAEVAIEAFVFQPAAITVPAGTTVTWTNNDPVAHSVTDVDGVWDSGLFEQGGVYSKTFTEPGTYTYYCIPHPMMIGTIEVQ